jgi:hypothetical protein
VVPDLHVVIRRKLEEQQVSAEGVQAYMKSLPDLKRYQSAFNVFWSQCTRANINLQSATLWEIASQLVKLNLENKNQARNAYSALLLIPSLDQLKFSPLLRGCKRLWSQSNARYPAFYDAASLVQQLSTLPLQWNSIVHVRQRLILAWRFIQLARSIDLQRLFRKISFVEERPFVWIHGKGWHSPRWEEVVCLPACPSLCPFTLLTQYVRLTASLPGVAQESEVLRSSQAPFLPLKANSIGSITTKALEDMGIPKSLWGAHSTRGAGVTMYKSLGLDSEIVCEIGKWKNTQAFASHYLRLGAPKTAGDLLQNLVHSVSSGGGAMPDWSRIPRTQDSGRSDQEGRAPTPDETTLVVTGFYSNLFVFWRGLFLTAWRRCLAVSLGGKLELQWSKLRTPWAFLGGLGGLIWCLCSALLVTPS